MKNFLLILSLAFSLVACSEKRESDIDANFGNSNIANPGGLEALPSNQTTLINTPFNATVPFVGNPSGAIFSIISNPNNGTVVINANTGVYNYIPNLNYSGTDIFSWKVEKNGETSVAIVNIVVTPVNPPPPPLNNPPIANNSTINVVEDTPISATVVATDPNGDNLSYSILNQPVFGSIVFNSNGTFTYTPGLNYNGSDSFSFKANDGQLDSNIGIITIQVTPVNDSPFAQNSSFVTSEEVAYSGNLAAGDVDSASITYSVVTQPNKGVLVVNSTTGSFTYTPNNNETGSDSFTFKVNDGQLDSNIATVSISITPVNDAPFALANNLTTNEDTVLNSTLTGLDPDGNSLTYAIVSPPTKGSVTITNSSLGTFVYIPNSNENGNDSFTFKVNDGSLDSNIATVSISITPVNDAPVANNSSFAVNSGSSYNGQTSANDIDSLSLTYILVSNPTKGTLTFNSNGSYSYVANNSTSGADSFTFKVNDGSLDSNIATVSINLNAVNQAPSVANLAINTPEDTSITSQVLGTDPENDSLSFSILTTPVSGSLVFNSNGTFTYTPGLNYNGSDSFTFEASDGQLNSNIGTVSISVASVNDAPVAQSNSFSINEDQILSNNLIATDLESTLLTYTIVSSPLKGSVSVNSATGSFTYTPNLNETGLDSFSFKVNDGSLDSNTATVSISISPLNDAPVLSNLNLSTPEDTVLASNFVFQDSDGPVVGPWTIVTPPSKGSVNITNVATGSFTYTPNLNTNGNDSFQVKLSDSISDSNIATINISVIPMNDIPVASNGNFAVNAGQTYNGNLIASDIDGDSLTYIIVSSPSKGSVSVNPATGSFTYIANLLSTGTDSFTFRVNDGAVNSNVATITVNLNLLNIAPIALSQSLSTPEDTTVSGQLSATDINGDSLSYSLVASSTNGVILLNSNGTFTYTPGLNYNGSDSFTFKVNDGQLDSNIATVFINVIPANDAPIALSQNFPVTQTVSFTNQVSATDIDSTSLSFSLVSNVSKGTLTFNTNGTFTYIANASATGSDSFTFKANDGQLDSNIATITFNINGFNFPPVANNLNYTGNEDSQINGMLSATDQNITDVLSYSIVTSSSEGTISLNSATGSFVFSPNLNFNGTTSFTYKANDGASDSNIATVNISVTAINDAPIANNQSFTINEDTVLNGGLTATDLEGNTLTYSIVNTSLKGSVTINSTTGLFTYTPNNNETGSDSFTFKVNDGSLDSNIATVSISITPVNDAPVANNQSISVTEDIPFVGTATASDVDGNLLTFILNSSPTKGSVVFASNGSFTYTPNNNETGTDSFTFKVNDGTSDSNIATISITISNQNDLPVANNQVISVNEDTIVNIVLTAQDIDGDNLVYSIVNIPNNGVLSGSIPNLTYTPNQDFNGTDSFTFKVNDGTGDSNIATISINVNPVNDSPISLSKNVTTQKNQPLSSFVVGNDIDSNSLTYLVVSPPSSGSVVLNSVNGTFGYTPNNNFYGNDSFTFKVNDGSLDSNVSTVSIQVLNPNTPPVAFNQNYTLNEDQSYGGNLQAQDNEGNQLVYTVITQPINGVLSYNSSNGTFTYTPNLNYNGSDSFTFKANDGQEDSNVATIGLTINSVNDLPIANNQSISVNQNSSNNSITLTGSDVESNNLNYITVAQPQNGTLTGSGNNLFYTPNVNFVGSDSFTFKVNDGSSDSNVAVVNITVNDLGGWCNPSFSFAHKLLLNNQDQGSLSNFPIMVKLNSSRINYSDVKSGGADLRFYDSNCNLLAHEIERWNPSGDSVVWVKVPNISANSNSSFVWMQYGNASASDAQNKNAVWSNDYVAVWHAEESSGNALADSTVNNNHLTGFGTPVQNSSGKVAGGELFNSSDDGYVESIEKPSLRVVNNISLESWVYITSCSGDDHVIEKYYLLNGSKKKDYALFVDSCKAKIRIGTKYIKYDTSLPLNKWIHIMGTFETSSNTCKIYINGVQKNQGTSCSEELSGLGGYKMTVGNDYPAANYLNAGVDEVRISKNARSSDWIKAQHLSMTDGYVSYGSKRELGDNFNHVLMTIKTNGDDGKIYVVGNSYYPSGHNGIVYQGSAGGRPVWGYYRFQLPQNIPANATIKKAMLRLYGKANTNNWTNQYLVLGMEKSSNATSISSAAQAPGGNAGLTTVGTGSSWGAPSLLWKMDEWNDSPNFKEIVVDLKNTQGGLSSGNYVQVFVTKSAPYGTLASPLLNVETTGNINYFLGLSADLTVPTSPLINIGLSSNLLTSLGLGNIQSCPLNLLGINCCNSTIEVGSEDNSFETLNHAQLMIEYE